MSILHETVNFDTVSWLFANFDTMSANSFQNIFTNICNDYHRLKAHNLYTLLVKTKLISLSTRVILNYI